jgi:hypothetical protein
MGIRSVAVTKGTYGYDDGTLLGVPAKTVRPFV